MWSPPSGHGGRSGARLWCSQLGHPLNVACCFPLPSQQIILRAFRPRPHRGQSLLAHHLSTHRQKANGRQDHWLTTGRGSVFWLRKWHIAAYPLTICFYLDNQSAALRSAELIGTMALEPAAPGGFAGSVARREFSANSPPSGTATDSAAFQCAGNLGV
jgi:hypothetical protein